MPFAASAEAVALGNESPFISATFRNADGDEVDGNSLAANQTYTVDLWVRDISSIAIFNLTADFTEDITITEVTSIAEVENSGFEYGGYKVDTDKNKFVIVISTVNNTTYTELSGETKMVTLTVETATDGDFADFFDISTDRNHTFIIANFEEGNEAAYVYKDCEQTDTDFPFLDYDMSPSSTITVTGTVKVARDEMGDTYAATSKVAGATVNVLNTQGDVVATTETDAAGQFTVAVPSEGVALELTKYCASTRTVALSGNEVTDYPVIPLIVVDYDSNLAWGAGDKTKFNEGLANNDPDMDLDGNDAWGAGDKAIFKYFVSGGLSAEYSDFTL